MDIKVPVEQIENSSSQFYTKKGDLEALVSQSKSMMQNLQSSFAGQRANRIFSEWEQMQPNLQNAIQSLQTAGDFMKKAASDFSATDSGF